jgi:hypothetical protein
MRIVTVATAAAFVALMCGVAPGAAAPRERSEAASSSAGADVAQSRPRRARPRIRVTPRRYYDRHFSAPYPLPYDFEYPGPNAVRECRARLVQEARPSGTVVVPRMRCRWVR